MSETQTESETDAEPTPGPARVCNGTHVRAHPEKAGVDTEIIMGPSHYGNDLPQEEQRANADLIAAAFNAAQEAKEMGYDAQKAVEALPSVLDRLEDARDALDAIPEDALGRDPDVGYPYLLELKDKINDALASAEGSGE